LTHRRSSDKVKKIGGSFNGRTADSDSVNPGSNPGPPAIALKGLLLTLFNDCMNGADKYSV
jgi:hypothetical protein